MLDLLPLYGQQIQHRAPWLARQPGLWGDLADT